MDTAQQHSLTPRQDGGFHSRRQGSHAGASSIPRGASRDPGPNSITTSPGSGDQLCHSGCCQHRAFLTLLPWALIPPPNPYSPFPPPGSRYVGHPWVEMPRAARGGSLQPRGSTEDPSSPQPKTPRPRCPRMAPLLTGVGRAASPGARTGLPRQPTPHATAREGSHRPSLPPQPRHMCFQCGWELQGVGVLRKQHQIPFRSSNGPQQPSRGRAGGGDARTLQDRAGAGGIPD